MGGCVLLLSEVNKSKSLSDVNKNKQNEKIQIAHLDK